MKLNLVKLFFLMFFAVSFAASCAQQAAVSDSPTEAYKRLFTAVKSKNTDAIKKEMTKTTQEFAAAQAEMTKQTLPEMYKNGFTMTTFHDSMPPMRDERIKDDMGAIEVQNPQGAWEDLAFVREEDGYWRLAVGDIFKGSYKKPAQPASAATNTQVPQMLPVPSMNPNNINAPMPKGGTDANLAVKPEGKKSDANTNTSKK